MTKIKIEPVAYLKITLPNGEAKVCKTVSQAARFYADKMSRANYVKAETRADQMRLGARFERDVEARYRRTYKIFDNILPRTV